MFHEFPIFLPNFLLQNTHILASPDPGTDLGATVTERAEPDRELQSGQRLVWPTFGHIILLSCHRTKTLWDIPPQPTKP